MTKAPTAACAPNAVRSRCFAAGVCRFAEFTFWVLFFFTSAFPFYGKILTFVDYVIVTKHFSKFSRLEGTLGIEFAPLWFPSVLEIAVLGPQRLWWGSVKFGQDFGRLSLSLSHSLPFIIAFVYSRSVWFQDVVSYTSEGGKSGIGKDRQLMKNMHSTRKVWRDPDANENPC